MKKRYQFLSLNVIETLAWLVCFIIIIIVTLIYYYFYCY